MAVVSVDLGCKPYSDNGVVVLGQEQGSIACEMRRVARDGTPQAGRLPAKNNGFEHSRCRERELGAPAKAGFQVKS